MFKQMLRRKDGPLLKAPRALLLTASAMLAALAPALLSQSPARASDHADTAENIARIGADMTDVYIFPSPQNANNVVLAMNVRGLIPTGQGRSVSFDPDVLYQFKIDNTGDSVEDLVIQARFEGAGRRQRVRITGLIAPPQVGTTTTFNQAASVRGNINRPFNVRLNRRGRPNRGRGRESMLVFAGAREDPFFFDLERFYQIFPDRQSPLLPPQPRTEDINTPEPNNPRVNGFRAPGEARDFFAGLNVLSIVVELPRTSMRGGSLGGGVIRLWGTTSVSTGGGAFQQQERLARAGVNEVFATVSNNRHRINNRINPTQDATELANDIRSFMRFPAGRSEAITNVVVSVLVPDVLIADLSQSGPAAFLGVETNGATGGRFGGRKLNDDIVDIDLGVIFGNTISALGLAPDDGQAKPQFATDNVGPEAKNFRSTFPYLGDPR